MGTTAIGFNIFLGGSMAVGKELNACRRGIAPRRISGEVVWMISNGTHRGWVNGMILYDYVYIWMFPKIGGTPKLDGL